MSGDASCRSFIHRSIHPSIAEKHTPAIFYTIHFSFPSDCLFTSEYNCINSFAYLWFLFFYLLFATMFIYRLVFFFSYLSYASCRSFLYWVPHHRGTFTLLQTAVWFVNCSRVRHWKKKNWNKTQTYSSQIKRNTYEARVTQVHQSPGSVSVASREWFISTGSCDRIRSHLISYCSLHFVAV